MRRLSFSLVLLSAVGAALVLPACSSGPYCSEFVDMTDRPVLFCDNPRADPVCDLPDQEGHFEEGPAGWMLVGAEIARCSADGEVVCPAGTVGEAYCIIDPEL